MTASVLKKRTWSGVARRALKPTEIVTRLASTPGWQLSGDGDNVAIEKTFPFANYYETISFVNAVAFVAHAQDHHPHLSVHYGRCVVRLPSQSVNVPPASSTMGMTAAMSHGWTP